jgi:hypothetical protein
MTVPPLKLKIDLVPETCWYKTLRGRMRRPLWDNLRKKVYADQGILCAVCQAEGRLNCHEIWEYDETRHVQRLEGFQAVCSMCHHATHFGKAHLLADQGRLDLNAVIEHFMKVNSVGREVFESHKTAAFRIWRERSTHQWQTDLGEWVSLVSAKAV